MDDLAMLTSTGETARDKPSSRIGTGKMPVAHKDLVEYHLFFQWHPAGSRISPLPNQFKTPDPF
jgi:hypothetical protein